jgi:hypothetical protein
LVFLEVLGFGSGIVVFRRGGGYVRSIKRAGATSRQARSVADKDGRHDNHHHPCRKGGVMETFMSDFIVVSIL